VVLDDSLKRVVFSKKDFLDPKKDPKRNTPKQRHDPTDPPKRLLFFDDSEFRNHFVGESGIPSGRRSFRGMLGSS